MTDKWTSAACVRLKDNLQAKWLQRYGRECGVDVLGRMRRDLEVSDSPSARFWRRIRSGEYPVGGIAVAEDRAEYGQKTRGRGFEQKTGEGS